MRATYARGAPFVKGSSRGEDVSRETSDKSSPGGEGRIKKTGRPPPNFRPRQDATRVRRRGAEGARAGTGRRPRASACCSPGRELLLGSRGVSVCSRAAVNFAASRGEFSCTGSATDGYANATGTGLKRRATADGEKIFLFFRFGSRGRQQTAVFSLFWIFRFLERHLSHLKY